MATSTPVGTFNKVLASTVQGYVDAMGMQVYNGNPLLNRILEKGNKRKWTGEAIRVKLVGAAYKTAQSYTDFDTGNVGVSEPFTVADFELGGYMQWVTMSGMQERKNADAGTRIFDIVKQETKVAVQSMKDLVSTHLYQATNDAKGFLSLATLTDATTTVAGVAGSGNWGGTTTTSGSFASQGLNDLWTLYLTLSQYAGLGTNGMDEPDLIVMNNTTSFRYYMANMQTSMRYTPNGKGDVGFGEITFMGKTVLPDPACASGNIYMLNTDHLFLYIMPGADMTVKEERMAYNADSTSIPILLNGQLVTNGRRYLGKLASVSA